MRWIICYDVTDDRRRREVSRLLEAVGDRVQGSVFEALLDRRLYDSVKREAEGLLDLSEDRIAFYPLCATCSDRSERLGPGTEVIPGSEELLLV